jgi:hypothetical protein
MKNQKQTMRKLSDSLGNDSRPLIGPELLHEGPLTAGLDHPRLEVTGPIRGTSRRLGHRSESGGGKDRVARLRVARRCSDAMTPILI